MESTKKLSYEAAHLGTDSISFIKEGKDDYGRQIRRLINTLKYARKTKTGFYVPPLKTCVTAEIMDCVKLKDVMSVDDLYQTAADASALLICYGNDYSYMAGRIIAARLQSFCPNTFSEYVERCPGVQKRLKEFTSLNREKIDSVIEPVRDYSHNYLGMMNMFKSVCCTIGNQRGETVQYVWMRVAMGMVKDLDKDWNRVVANYHALSKGELSMASPILFNAGTTHGATASCYLLDIDDNIHSIGQFYTRATTLVAENGGLGVNLSRLRCLGSKIKPNGKANGIMPVMKTINTLATSVSQGNKRPGAIATYLAIYHADFEDWLVSRSTVTGSLENKCDNIFMGVWMHDLFIKRARNNEDWSFFCPNECEGLDRVYGEEFDKLYESYETAGKARKTVKAFKLLETISNVKVATGMPYILNATECNKKNNQSHLGVLNSSSLCAEILQHCSAESVSVCNLATVPLKNAILIENGESRVDYDVIAQRAYMAARNLNDLIDMGKWGASHPSLVRKLGVDENGRGVFDEKYNVLEYTVKRTRDVGIGVQGLGSLFMNLRIPYSDDRTYDISKKIFEALCFGAYRSSCDLAMERGQTYETYEKSPLCLEGKMQFDFWEDFDREKDLSHDKFNWEGLFEDIKRHGVMNSMMITQPPTASSSMIYGNSESIECITSNRVTRSIANGDYVVLNENLERDLRRLGLWDVEMIRLLEEGEGSLENIERIPSELKELYKIAREQDHGHNIKMVAAMSPFACQGFSFNAFLNNKDLDKQATRVAKDIVDGMDAKIKTVSYYHRGGRAANASGFGKRNYREGALTSDSVYECASCSA